MSSNNFTRTDSVNWLITKLNKTKNQITLHFLHSLVCQFNSECTECPLFEGMQENTVQCNKVKED